MKREPSACVVFILPPGPARGEPASTRMGSVFLLLFLAAVGTVSNIAVIPYAPQISTLEMAGTITGSTFVLATPLCIFDAFAIASDSLWLLVVFANATATFKTPAKPQEIPPYEDLFSRFGYVAMISPISPHLCNRDSDFYPTTSNALQSVLRVGNDSVCKNNDSRTYCNGPLVSPGPYRVKFLIMNATSAKAETSWSEPILLNKAQERKTLDTWPGRRSGDMIVITVILSALSGVVTAGFLSTVCNGCVKLWQNGPPENQDEQQRSVRFQDSRYNVHQISLPPNASPPALPADMAGPQLISTAS